MIKYLLLFFFLSLPLFAQSDNNECVKCQQQEEAPAIIPAPSPPANVSPNNDEADCIDCNLQFPQGALPTNIEARNLIRQQWIQNLGILEGRIRSSSCLDFSLFNQFNNLVRQYHQNFPGSSYSCQGDLGTVALEDTLGRREQFGLLYRCEQIGSFEQDENMCQFNINNWRGEIMHNNQMRVSKSTRSYSFNYPTCQTSYGSQVITQLRIGYSNDTRSYFVSVVNQIHQQVTSNGGTRNNDRISRMMRFLLPASNLVFSPRGEAILRFEFPHSSRSEMYYIEINVANNSVQSNFIPSIDRQECSAGLSVGGRPICLLEQANGVTCSTH